ncbi:MAG: type VII secretion protein EssC, partial [Ruminococcaceae bacterium]|nr:type VII secretion protein EssC [Oscillospiraceae bacterium]
MQQMKLWMPLLPQELYLDNLPGYENTTYDGNWSLSVPIGLGDDPENQAQFPVYIDFSETGHLAVCGTITSGKSTFLQTLVYALMVKYTPEWLNFYILDFSSRMLSCFEKAPHLGGIMYEDDFEKIAKFMAMLERVIEERKRRFSGSNYTQYTKVKGVSCPVIMIVIDNLGAFREKTENRYDEKLIHLLREG